MSKMQKLYNMYIETPRITNADAAAALDISETMLRTMKTRLKQAGYIDTDNGEVLILKPYRGAANNTVANTMKVGIYTEMIETYMEDFREQTTFADRLAVGREIRLLLDKL